MDRRENFALTVQHRQPGRVTVDLGGCPLSGMSTEAETKLLQFLGYDEKDPEDARKGTIDRRILRYYDIDTRGVGSIFTPRDSLFRRISDTEYVDEWGVRRIFTGQYWDIVHSPLEGASLGELEQFRWPDPESVNPEAIRAAADEAERLFRGTDLVVCASHPVYGIFELGCWMCGFEDFLCRMAAEPEFVHRFFEIVLEYQKKVIRNYYGALGRHIHYTTSGDDFATQHSTFMSRAMFDEFILPYLKERLRYTKQFTNAYFLHHSCGNVRSLINSLIEAGVEILNPVQPTGEDMQPRALKETFAGRVVFHGGFDTQRVLQMGSPELVEREVERLLGDFAPGGGYIFAAAHNIQGDVPVENIDAMLRAAKAFRLG